MKLYMYAIPIVCLLFPLEMEAQDKPTRWTLTGCLNYALEHNIRIQQSKVNLLSGDEDTRAAKARLFPSLSASVTQGFVNYPSGETTNNNSYTGNYSMSANWTLFDGGRRLTAVKQQEIRHEVNGLSVEQNEKDIRVSLVQAYMQALYAVETVRVNENTVEVSGAQVERARELFRAGSISQVDLAQMESQYSSDKYQLVVAGNNLENYKLQLKQLLELDITEEMELAIPELTSGDVAVPLPGKEEIYARALAVMPEIRSGERSIDLAALDLRLARAGYFPTLSANAGIGTGHLSGTNYTFGSQMWNRFNESVGLTLSIPIFSNRDNKTAVNKAKLSAVNSRLDLQNTQKNLLKTVEGIYLDAVSSQNQYVSAVERLKYVEQSFRLTQEQFFLGMKNTLELLTEQNNLLKAQQEALQSKYMAIMSIQLLNVYQKKPIDIDSDKI
jgi:outer membrane protein